MQPVCFDEQDIAWLTEAARQQIAGCRKRAFDGTVLFTPDGIGNYDAHWTRDFYYMTQALDLMDAREVRAGIQYLLQGQRADGVIPDRRQADGTSVYCAGPPDHPIADFPLDNAAFMVLLVADFVRHTGQIDLFRDNAQRLERAMASVPLSEAGLVFNDPEHPHSPYGFTDCIAKTGEELFCSLLDWRAANEMARLYAQISDLRRAGIFQARAQQTAAALTRLWDERSGMFLAASCECRQIDIWGNALCVYLDFPLAPSRRAAIVDYLVAHADEVTQRGQVRHLPAGEHWQRLLIAVPEGVYQNGGFWGTASGWYLDAVAQKDAVLAARLFRELVQDYRARGIHEWVNGETAHLPNYVASAVNPLVAVRRLVERPPYQGCR
ncbi:MAG: hypothetical protein RMN25_08760 [Anaerolineae bacterium]|nr:hypothetical protein [Thermoflexales bacterium]MDW8407864.1 hypothetical protein [Anaerolineae bacterium]